MPPAPGVIGFDFFPDAARARALDARMHLELGKSLEHVREASAGHLAFDDAGVARLISDLIGGRQYPPAVFARYYECVIAIDDDDPDEAIRLLGELSAAAPARPGLEVFTLDDPALGAESARYMRMMNADTSVDLGFLPPTREVAQAFRPRLNDGLALLDAALPELAGEIRAILRQIVIAGSDPTKKYQFDGGSHFQLWGALFLNGQYHPDRVAVAEVLAHESAHSLLFGFCTDEALVENDDDELFSSPLRVDPRPMDGIYHATFVSARMHWAMSALACSPILTDEERARALAAAAADLRNFDAGHGVVAAHGRLTGVGAGLMSSAARYMESQR